MTQTLVERLLPCPFCGGEAEIVSPASYRHYVRCMECSEQFEHGRSENAVAAWNRRAALASASEPVAWRHELERIIAIDQREQRTCIEFDPAGSTYEVTNVDGPCAEIARRLLASPPVSPAGVEATDDMITRLADIAGEHLEIDYDGEEAFVRSGSIEAAVRAMLAACPPIPEAQGVATLPTETGVKDKDGNALFLGDRVRYRLEGRHTKEEYWNPEYEIIWDAPKFTLKHVGGGKDGGSHDFILRCGGGNGDLELIKRAAQPASDAGPEATHSAASEAPRPCTCHPDDSPPRPCPQKYALTECRAAASEAPEAGEPQDGWIEWKGGGVCPVNPDVLIETKHGDGTVRGPLAALGVDWGLRQSIKSRVVAYRITPQAEKGA